MNPVRLPGFRAALLGGALALAQGPTHAQTTFLPTPAHFSGTESIQEFEGLTAGDRITTEIPGLTFSLVGGDGVHRLGAVEGDPRDGVVSGVQYQ